MKKEVRLSLAYRDMWQSWGKYFPTVTQLKEVAPAIISMGCFDRIETNGGAFEQVCLLMGENPNKAVREWTAPFNKAGIQTMMLERGLCALRMNPVPADVRELMFRVKKAQSIGDRILVNNGLVIFEVKEITHTDVICRVVVGGELSDRKSMSFPGKVLKQTYLSEQDKADLLFGIENEVDFIAASFVSRREDLLDLKAFLHEHGGDSIDIIAKIENRSGIDNIEQICEECSGIMIGRGDLGVEVPFTELPALQKYLITKCRLLGKRVITATEMLESMIQNPRPTRAEISDVANAVYDGTSAVMLSGESAAGKYPVQTVKTMAEIVEETEKHIHYATRFKNNEFKIKNRADAISHATCGMAIDIGAKAIVVTSMSGMTVRMVSRFRSPTDIVGMAVNKKVWYKLALSWGVLPVLTEHFNSTDVLFYHALKAAKEALHLKEGDSVVMTAGDINGASGNTNLIKVETV